ncbi:MAG TPA: cisplatin damage response ATP-dependent DNA ligase [Hyphomicrobiaceae bacterium]|nr:cisplatin damage response ATP-dependent DNA ligase [Hyphomicrobiaceae bacterium]
MERFARLLDTLAFTPARNGKLAAMEEYFRAVPDPDRGYALAALTDGLPIRVPIRRILADLIAARMDPVLYKLSRDFVGDTAETVALLWPEPDSRDARSPAPILADLIASLATTPSSSLGRFIAGTIDRLDSRGRWAFLKLVGGAPRVGVSARLAKTAAAAIGAKEVAEVEEVWHALAPPYRELFAWLEGHAPRPDVLGKPVFRPLMLAHPLEDSDLPAIKPSDFVAEWKWDGIRVQVAAGGGATRLFSRTGDDISSAFPEIAEAFAGREVTADGELLVVRGGIVAPFNELQQRLNRKAVTRRQLADHPAHVRLYDVLTIGERDLRPRPLLERRRELEAWHSAAPPRLTDLSTIVPFADLDALRRLRDGARDAGIEGLMLKRADSPYLAGRPKGHWYKWKRAALTLDCVLMYAQRGSEKRSSLYSDYTFGVWREGERGPDLVPVGKAYSGFTDEELVRLDRFIRANTVETYGPVRAVRAELVLEIAFDAIQRSARHKSGVAMRFPRVHRIRWDKPAAEADTLATAKALIENSA